MKTNSSYADFDLRDAMLDTLDQLLEDTDACSAALPTIDPALLKHLPRIGQKTESFAGEALALAKLYPDLLPRGLDLEQGERALVNRRRLIERYMKMRKLTDRLEYAIVLMGIDAFDAARSAYRAMKSNTKDPVVKEMLKPLAKTFRGKARKKEGSSAKPAAPARPAAEAIQAPAPARPAPPDVNTNQDAVDVGEAKSQRPLGGSSDGRNDVTVTPLQTAGAYREGDRYLEPARRFLFPCSRM